ncbi:rod shape-determining protein RodA [Rickettsiales bacterium]|nr:rod shape-determining protein RodA [Rickettsiales bacterium]
MQQQLKKEDIINKIAKLNWSLISLIFLLSVIGLAMLYSAAGGNYKTWMLRQFIYFIVFFPVMIAIAIIDINFWFRHVHKFYFIGIALLLFVYFKGHYAMGATRWFRLGFITIQPSEIMKVFLVLSLAKYFHNIEAEEIQKIKYVTPPLILIFLPTGLIFAQPDLGTSLILLFVGFVILFVAGVMMWKFVLTAILALISMPILWFFFLHSYQRDRIKNFINPDSDPMGTGYNIIQSKIAIGSGGFSGKGFINGTQTQLGFLPERQTDFIFTILSEEFGFIGSISIVFICLLIVFSSILMASKSLNQYSKLVIVGISSIFFFHSFINIGMTIGLLPVVGAPLPFMSYGGTITATMLIGFGFVLNVGLYNDSELK